MADLRATLNFAVNPAKQIGLKMSTQISVLKADGDDVLLYKTSDGLVAPFFAVLSESGNAGVWLPCAIPAIMTMFLSLADRDQHELLAATLRCLVRVRRSRIPILFGEQNIWGQLGLL
jgi:hypothetical protein